MEILASIWADDIKIKQENTTYVEDESEQNLRFEFCMFSLCLFCLSINTHISHNKSFNSRNDVTGC